MTFGIAPRDSCRGSRVRDARPLRPPSRSLKPPAHPLSVLIFRERVRLSRAQQVEGSAFPVRSDSPEHCTLT